MARKFYFAGLALVAIGLPVSVFLMSFGQLVLLATFLFDGELKVKLKRFYANKPAVIAASVLVLHMLGMIYTHDLGSGFSDIRIKVPLLILPVFIAGSQPISSWFFHRLMGIFIAAVTLGTLICIGVYAGLVPTRHVVNDIRDISIFISHIRFSMMIALAVLLTGYYFYSQSAVLMRLGFLLLICWLLYFLFVLNSLTGIVLLLCTVVFLLVYGIFSIRRKPLKAILISGLLLLLAGLGVYGRSLFSEVVLSPLHGGVLNVGTKTAMGNEYTNDSVSTSSENGYAVWMYVCDKELESAWNKRSHLAYYGYNKKGDLLRFTVIRYLSSKGLPKDAAAVNSLSDPEIKWIEDGIANVNYEGRLRLSVRILETVWEFRNYLKGNDPNGHSVIMRIEFWRAAMGIVRSHPLLGVGTGDMKTAFQNQYVSMHSPLDANHRLRSHNQFLAIAVGFGSVGLLWFLFALFYPPIRILKGFDYFYTVFFIIAFFSFFTEDTLESQAGVTFFAFFNALFLFGRSRQESLKGDVPSASQE